MPSVLLLSLLVGLALLLLHTTTTTTTSFPPLLLVVDALAVTPDDLSRFKGSWRHIRIPTSDVTPKFFVSRSNDSSSTLEAEAESALGSAFSRGKSSSSDLYGGGEEEENRKRKLQEQLAERMKKLKQKQQADRYSLEDEVFPEEVTLDLNLGNFSELIQPMSSSSSFGFKGVTLNWKKGGNDFSSSSSFPITPRCTARMIGVETNKKSAEESDDDENLLLLSPKAVEISCESLNTILDQEAREIVQKRKEAIAEREEREALQEQIKQDHETLFPSASNRFARRNHRKKKKKKNYVDPDFDPNVGAFDFLNWNDTSLIWPMARVSVVIHEKEMKQKQKQEKEEDHSVLRRFIDSSRWYEGTSSACLETNTFVTDSASFTQNHQQAKQEQQQNNNNNNEDESIVLPGTSAIRVIVPLSRSTSSCSDSSSSSSSSSLKKKEEFSEKAMMSVRIKLLPLGARTPTHRQLIRWFRFPSVLSSSPTDSPTLTKDEAKAKILEKQRKKDSFLFDDEDDLQINNTFFELRATEKRLTRLGLGFRARLRRHGSGSKSNNNNNNNDHLPILTNWSVEVFRRVPRPRVECVAMFSRLLSIPSLFKPTEKLASSQDAEKLKHQQQEEAAAAEQKKKNDRKKKEEADDFDDFFDDDDLTDDAEEQKEERKRKREQEERKLLQQRDGYIGSGFPGMEAVESAKMQLLSAHQLRGLLDDAFLLPELSRLSPVTTVPSGPAPNLISEEDSLRAQRLPPRGLYVLYVSEEQTREHDLDVGIQHADFTFIAPLKMEKKVLNVTYKGVHDRLPLPVPPFANWTWFDSTKISSFAPIVSPKHATASTTEEKVRERQEKASRAVIPKLFFHYSGNQQQQQQQQQNTENNNNNNNNIQAKFPGFSIVLEQARPMDELQVWVLDGKNDTLFLDDEVHLPFTVPGQTHDAVDNPLFGWRLALDSQRAFALDTVHVSVGWKFRPSSPRDGNPNPESAADYVTALSQWESGKEAAYHLLSWVDLHRWIPLTSSRSKTTTTTKRRASLPFFPNFIEIQRKLRDFRDEREEEKEISNNKNNKKLPFLDSLDISVSSEEGNNWKLFTRRKFSANEEIFTLPWSSLIRHSQAPEWISRMIDCEDFEQVVKRHENYLLSNDHVDLDTEEEIIRENEALLEEEEQREKEQSASSTSSGGGGGKRKNSKSVQSKRFYDQVRSNLQKNRNVVYSNIKAWAIITMMHWTQAEPELLELDHNEWRRSSTSLRWHSHYRMFNERVKNDPARRLRKFIKTRRAYPSGSSTRTTIPSSSWSSLVESVSKRNSFLGDLANYFLEVHPGLPKSFSGGQVDARDWFASAFTIIEARSLLVTLPSDVVKNSNNKRSAPVAEWVYCPLLDLASPSQDDANIRVSFVEAGSHHLSGENEDDDDPEDDFYDASFTSASEQSKKEEQNKNKSKKTKKKLFALSVVASGKAGGGGIKSGSPLIFDGWSARGLRTAQHGLELFGIITPRSGFSDTASILLPFGPSLVVSSSDASSENQKQQQQQGGRSRKTVYDKLTGIINKDALRNSQRKVLEECLIRCKRVSDGKSVSVNDDDFYNSSSSPTSTKTESFSSCCNLNWLYSSLLKKWKQVVAQEFYWNLNSDSLKKLMLSSNVKRFPRFFDDDESSGDFVGVTPSPEPPSWRASRQQLLTGTRKVLEKHLEAISRQQQQDENNNNKKIDLKNVTSMSLTEKMQFVFNHEEEQEQGEEQSKKRFVEDAFSSSAGNENIGNSKEEVAWFSCCQNAQQERQDSDGDL